MKLLYYKIIIIEIKNNNNKLKMGNYLDYTPGMNFRKVFKEDK